MYQVSRLESGLIIATAEMPHMASVSVGVWVGIGARYEPVELNGICHFIEHLLFKGTQRRSAKQISQAIEGVGGYLNAFTSEEATCFHAKACEEYFPLLLDVLLDMLHHSKFDPGEIDKEREVIKEEIAMYLDQPHHQVQELLNETLWPGQPLGRPITGTRHRLDRIHRGDLVRYLSDHYLANNVIIVAAGKSSHRQVRRAIGRYEKRFKVGSRPKFPAALNGQAAAKIRLVTRKTEQTQLALGIRTCSRHDPRRYALRLLNAILGENMSSRLFQSIREEHALAYSIYSTPSFFDDTGDLVISAGLDADNLPKTIQFIMRELRRLRDTPPGRAELRRACDYVVGQTDLTLESTDNQMNWVGEQLLGYGNVITAAAIKKRLRSVTAGQIRAVACDFFRPEHLNLALVSPLKRVGTLSKLLRL